MEIIKTNQMKKILLLLLMFTAIVDAQIVNIPDANLKAALLSANATNQIAKNMSGTYGAIDTNGDGQIQNTEALQILELNIYATGITSITGIESFSNLTALYLMNLQVAAIDATPLTQLQKFRCIMASNVTNINLSGLINLTSVNCIQNTAMSSINLSGDLNLETVTAESGGLTSLDVSGFTFLTTLVIDDNPLGSLNVQGCTALSNLQIDRNNLTTLDISGCTGMVGFNSATGLDTSLTTVIATGCTSLANFTLSNHPNLAYADFSGCGALTNLDLSYDSLTSLNLSGCSGLADLNVAVNGLTTLDLSAFHHLNVLDASLNSLSTLVMKNGSIETNVTLFANPALQFICADEGEISYLSGLTGLNGVVIDPYCSFTPGGDFNTINGTIRLDADNNGCDAGDIIPPNVRINTTDGTNSSATFTNELGNYKLYTSETGNFTLTPILENPDYFDVSPLNPTLNIPLIDNSVQTQNFCLTANGIHPDLEIIIVPAGGARPGFDADYALVFKNKGNHAASGFINVIFDDAHTDFVSAFPTAGSQISNSISWNFSNLLPFETRIVYFKLNINSTVENPPVHIGDYLDFSALISPVSGDDVPADNTFNLHQQVVNSLDPNDKTCLEGGTMTVDNVGKYLHYNINFENTGTSNAVNVVVKDIIDTTKFDMDSLQLIYSSASVETKITGNKVEFIFENINLPPSATNPIGGHGNVLFKIKTLPTLAIGDEVANTANIYFDYNAPIDTNEARTAFTSLAKADFVKDSSVTVYPNPAKNKVSVKAAGNIQSVQLYDVQGRILETLNENKKEVSIDLSQKQKGVYFLKVTTEKGISVQKIVKD